MKFLIGFTLLAFAAAEGNQLNRVRYLPTFQNTNNAQGQAISSPSIAFTQQYRTPSYTIPSVQQAPLQHIFAGHPQTSSFTNPSAAGGRYLTPTLHSSYGLPVSAPGVTHSAPSANNQLQSNSNSAATLQSLGYPSPLAQQAARAINVPASFALPSLSYSNTGFPSGLSPPPALSGSGVLSGQHQSPSPASSTLSSSNINGLYKQPTLPALQTTSLQIAIPSYSSGLLDLSQSSQYRSNTDLGTKYADNGGYDYRRNKIIRN